MAEANFNESEAGFIGSAAHIDVKVAALRSAPRPPSRSAPLYFYHGWLRFW